MWNLRSSVESKAIRPSAWITRLHPQGKGGPEGDFLCAENTLNVYHTYHDVTIQNPSIIDLAWKLKIFLYQIVTKIDKNRQKLTDLIIFDQKLTDLITRTHICFWRHVCKDREHKKPLRGKTDLVISEDYAKSTRFLDILFKFRKKWKLMLDGGVAGAGRPRKGAKSLASMFFWSNYAAAARPIPNRCGDRSILVLTLLRISENLEKSDFTKDFLRISYRKSLVNP